MKRKKKFDRLEEFINILVEDEKKGYFISCPSIEGQFALDCLSQALLGPDYYIAWPISVGQCNVVILDTILKKYSRDYRRLVKKKQKELRKHE